jgi:hypothetical protein
MKTKIFMFGLLIFLPSTNLLAAKINSNIQTGDPNDSSQLVFEDHNTGHSKPINSEPETYMRPHVEPSWDPTRNALIDWAGNEVQRLDSEFINWPDFVDLSNDANNDDIEYCFAEDPYQTTDGKWIDGCGRQVPDPYSELIVEQVK